MFNKISALLCNRETVFRKQLLDDIFLSLGKYEGSPNTEDLIAALNYLHALIEKENEYAKRSS